MKNAASIWITLIILMVAASAVSAVKYFIYRDFIVTVNAPCDPAQHSCFVSEDDTAVYFKKVAKSAHNIPPCNAWNGECPEDLSCAPGEKKCTETYCDPEHDGDCYSESQ